MNIDYKKSIKQNYKTDTLYKYKNIEQDFEEIISIIVIDFEFNKILLSNGFWTPINDKHVCEALSSVSIFVGKAINVEENTEYNYPKSNKEALQVKSVYDFIFSKSEVWFYMASSNNYKIFTSDEFQLHVLIENISENWKVLDSKTGAIMLENKPKLSIVK